MDHNQRRDPNAAETAGLAAWLVTSCSPAEQATLRERIAVHEQRLHGLAPEARSEAVVDALLHDATTNLILAGALDRLQRRGVERRQERASLN